MDTQAHSYFGGLCKGIVNAMVRLYSRLHLESDIMIEECRKCSKLLQFDRKKVKMKNGINLEHTCHRGMRGEKVKNK